MLASENLKWKSSNKNVASVSKDGEVTLSGHNGKTFISVSDGSNNGQNFDSIQGKSRYKSLLKKKKALVMT